MAVVPSDNTKPAIWDEYKKIINKYEKDFKGFEFIERFSFYDRAKKAFAIIATSEEALYANIILKKGVIKI
jgi:L-fucose mutarotase